MAEDKTLYTGGYIYTTSIKDLYFNLNNNITKYDILMFIDNSDKISYKDIIKNTNNKLGDKITIIKTLVTWPLVKNQIEAFIDFNKIKRRNKINTYIVVNANNFNDKDINNSLSELQGRIKNTNVILLFIIGE